MTLLFAGHDTTTSTVAFMFYELARNPELLDDPAISVEMILDETLRKYPPAYIGPRRSIEAFEFNGVHVPAGAHVHYCSWASHHLPDVWPEPDAFRPERFSRGEQGEAPAAPTCRSAAARAPASGCASARRRSRSSRGGSSSASGSTSLPGFELEIRQAPTISPRRGLPVMVRSAAPAAVLAAYA